VIAPVANGQKNQWQTSKFQKAALLQALLINRINESLAEVASWMGNGNVCVFIAKN
jgi:hypothetical protein